MSNELDDLARSLFNGQLPAMWRKLAPATKKSLGNWMDHFQRRNHQYTTWVLINSISLITPRIRFSFEMTKY